MRRVHDTADGMIVFSANDYGDFNHVTKLLLDARRSTLDVCAHVPGRSGRSSTGQPTTRKGNPVRVFENVQLPIGFVTTSQAIQMADNNTLSVSATLLVGTVVPTLVVEGSHDLSNWSATGITGTLTITAAPSLVTASFTGITYAYTRVKLTGSTAATLLNVDANPQKL